MGNWKKGPEEIQYENAPPERWTKEMWLVFLFLVVLIPSVVGAWYFDQKKRREEQDRIHKQINAVSQTMGGVLIKNGAMHVEIWPKGLVCDPAHEGSVRLFNGLVDQCTCTPDKSACGWMLTRPNIPDPVRDIIFDIQDGEGRSIYRVEE